MRPLIELRLLAAPDSRSPRSTTICWWVMFVFAVPISAYGILMVDQRGMQSTVFGQAWVDVVHFVGGGIALLVGALAFNRGILKRTPGLHRRLGFVYFMCVLASGGAGLAMATQSWLGMTTHLGFGCLAVAWLSTSALGWRAIRRGDVLTHRRWMVRSYAACYAAVMLRLHMILLPIVFGDFTIAYRIVSWSCWVPNLLFAEWWLRNTSPAGRWLRKSRG